MLYGSYRVFERLMAGLLVLMFASVLLAAAMFRHDWSAVASGLLLPRIPREAGPAGIQWTLAMMGGVGGTLTVLCYGYWIRESGRTGPEDLRLCRLDLGVAYLFTGLFGVAMAMLAVGMDLVGQGGGETMMVLIADRLGEILGRPFKYVFLLGAWGAVITSLLGVWQAAPYLFADFWSLLRKSGHGHPDPAPADADATAASIDRRSTPYRTYLLCLASIPALSLHFDFVLVQKAQAMLGAIVMPLLALALLILNGRPSLVGKAHRNRPLTVVVLVAVLAFFACAGYLTLLTGKSILS